MLIFDQVNSLKKSTQVQIQQNGMHLQASGEPSGLGGGEQTGADGRLRL